MQPWLWLARTGAPRRPITGIRPGPAAHPTLCCEILKGLDSQNQEWIQTPARESATETLSQNSWVVFSFFPSDPVKTTKTHVRSPIRSSHLLTPEPAGVRRSE